MSEYRPDPDFAETKVKNPGKSKGRKGNVPPKTYVVPDLITTGSYSVDKPAKQQTSGGYSAGWKPRSGRTSQSPDGQNVKYQAPRDAGQSAISTLPGQYTKMPKSGGR